MRTLQLSQLLHKIQQAQKVLVKILKVAFLSRMVQVEGCGLLHLLAVSLLVFEFLFQGSPAALSVVPLTVHLLRDLFQLLLN